MNKIDIDVHPEFSYELALVLPYANWLKQNDMLGKVYTSKGMTPFYYFADDVEEKYTSRTVGNDEAGMDQIPNNWIHHNAMAVFGKDYSELTEVEKVQANGVLDYSKWSPPEYRVKYGNNEFTFGRPFVVISNRFNYEHGDYPEGYFDVECLYYLFTLLTEAGYAVIYKRPNNSEFPIDENEYLSLGLVLEGKVDGYGHISDWDLARAMDNVYLLNDIDTRSYTYNEMQLRIFANANGFISMAGGNGIFCSYFKVPNVTYVTTSGELRDGYFDAGTYYRMLSGAEIYAVRDDEKNIKERGHRDYVDLYIAVKKAFLSTRL